MIPARLLLDNAIVIMFHRWENLSISQLVNEEVGVQTSKPGCFISHSSLGFVTVQAFHQEDFPERARYREQTGPGLIFRKVKMLVTQSFPTLYDPMDCCPPGSFVHGFSSQEYWSTLPCPPSGDLPNPGIEPRSPALQADSLLSEPIQIVI